MTQTLLDTSTNYRMLARKVTDQWLAEGGQPLGDSWLRGFDPKFSQRLADAGLIGMTWPKQYGGAEARNTDRLAATEELLRAGAPVGAHWIGDRQIGPSILRHGTERLREEILPQIVSMNAVFCLGMSEVNAGSDLASVQTRAEPTEGGWLLTGQKIWTGNAHHATHAYVLARSSEGEAKHQGLSEFIVDMNNGGVTVTPILNVNGEHRFNRVNFEEVFVPRHRLLGEEGNGWRQVVEQLSFERGGAERFLSSYLLLGELIRRASAETPDIARLLGSLAQRLAVLRRLCWEVAVSLDEGQAPVKQAAALKMLGNRFEVDVIEALRQLPAPEDLRRDSLYAQTLQSSPGFQLRGGSVEVLLFLIARLEAKA